MTSWFEPPKSVNILSGFLGLGGSKLCFVKASFFFFFFSLKINYLVNNELDVEEVGL